MRSTITDCSNEPYQEVILMSRVTTGRVYPIGVAHCIAEITISEFGLNVIFAVVAQV